MTDRIRPAFLSAALLGALGLAAAPSGAGAQMRMALDQAEARERAAPLIPLPRIVAAVRAQPPFDTMQYLGGPEYDVARRVYRLKFLDGRRLVLVLVDARTGQLVRVR